MKYGKLNNGLLTTIELKAYKEKYEDENGEIQERSITVETQATMAREQGYKPVDDIDETILSEAPTGKVAVFTPIDLGDHISFEYKTVVDRKYYKREIDKYKKELAESDYKITKCYEASLVGEQLPYDIQTLHSLREAARCKINELENQFNNEL